MEISFRVFFLERFIQFVTHEGTGAVTEVGVGGGKGTTVNIPFSGDVMGDAEYL